MAYELDNGRVVCEQCGNDYERIASHWSTAPECEYPSLSDHQMEIATGLLMGDGWINRGGKTPWLHTEMISPRYLKYVNDIFGIFGSGVSLRKTAEESAKQTRKRGFSPSAKSEDYSDVYQWRTIAHPDLQPFAEWYDGGGKVWPEDIELTPTVLKHWYCGDGSYNNDNYINITMSNEVGNVDKVDKYFKCANLPRPTNYDIYEEDDRCVNGVARFTVEQSRELWEYMGEPLPDFEYKWPASYQGVEEQKTATA